ncbi:MAG: hypothetical protein ACK5PJ_07865 [Ralstonia sp.]|jgi:hypothetical protein
MNTVITNKMVHAIIVACGWEERDDAEDQARAALSAVAPMILEAAAKVAESRYEKWRMPHKDDAKPGEVCCDVTACADIAAAIRALKEPRP